MLDLESAIRYHTVEAEKMKLHKKVNEIILGTEGYERKLQEHTQTAEWLTELAERRKQPEIIRCKDCKYNVSSHKCLHPESFFLVPSDDFYCGYSKRRTDD